MRSISYLWIVGTILILSGNVTAAQDWTTIVKIPSMDLSKFDNDDAYQSTPATPQKEQHNSATSQAASRDLRQSNEVRSTIEPSFSCKARLSPAEKVICANPELGEADRNMAQAFSDLMTGARESDRVRLIREQKSWLDERDVDCGFLSRSSDFELLKKPAPIECLKDKYAGWTHEISDSAATQTLRPKDIGFPATRYLYIPQIIQSSDPKLCSEVLTASTADFKATDDNGMDGDTNGSHFSSRLKVAIPGSRWLTLPTGSATADYAAELDGNGHKSLIVYSSTDFTTGSGPGRDLRLFIQPKADRNTLSAELDVYRALPVSLQHKATAPLVAIPPFIGRGKWPDSNPIHIFRYGSRYYFFSYVSTNDSPYDGTRVLRVQLLHGDGTVTPACTVQLNPDLHDSGLVSQNKGWSQDVSWWPSPDDWFSQHTEKLDSITLPVELARFFGAIRQLQGEEGPWSGSGHFLDELIGETATVNEMAVIQPWRLMADAPSAALMSLADTEAALHVFAMDSISNFRLFESYRSAKPKALEALSTLYQKQFGLPQEAADKASANVLDHVISSSFIFSPNQGNPSALAGSLDDKAALTEISEYHRARGTGASLVNADTLLKWALLVGAPQEDVTYLLENGAHLRSGGLDPDNYTEPTLFYALDHPNFIATLVGKGADIQATNVFGKTALMYAAQYDEEESVRVLLKNGANVAARTGYLSADGKPAQELLGGEISINCNSRTALMYAAANASAAIIELLLDAGASPTDKDTCGHTLKDYFAKNVLVSPAERHAIQTRI